MNEPPHRTALLALAMLLLAGAFALWWPGRGTHPDSALTSSAGRSANDAISETGVETPDGWRAIASMDATIAACQRAIMSAFNERALELRQKQDATSQLAFAFAVPMDPSIDLNRMQLEELQRVMAERESEIRAAFLRAAALAPDDPDVLWLAATRCGSGRDCLSVQRALLASEPDNMIVWLQEVSWAKMRGDSSASKIAMQRAAAAPMYDTHPGVSQEVMMRAYAGMPMPAVCLTPETRAAEAQFRKLAGTPDNVDEANMLDHALAIGILNGNLAGLTFFGIRQQCMPSDNAMDREQRANCGTIMMRLAGGDTLLERTIGLDTMVQLTVESSEGAVWRERYRQNLWLSEQQWDAGIQSLYRVEDFTESEVQTMQAALEAAGRWPPPANWLPADERSRSLIQTGRPPPPKRR